MNGNIVSMISVEIPAKLVVKVEFNGKEKKITSARVELGHHLYASLDVDSISEAFWQEIWRRVERR